MKYYLLIYLKGIAMGAADVVPGVSGGTIAFITGIYDKLLDSISKVHFNLFQKFKSEGFAAVWDHINGNFLLALIAGVVTSILSLAKLITFFMHHYPIQLWSFFFGLIVASIFYVGKNITQWRWIEILMLFMGASFIYWISVMPPLGASSSYLYLFLAGAIAACAMILPGISGSFILLILGAYATIMTGIANRDFLLILVVAAGAVTGLLSFSKILKYFLLNYYNPFVALLTGFLIGSLWKIWPWKIDEQIFVKGEGVRQGSELLSPYQSLTAYFSHYNQPNFEYKTYLEKNISPFLYEQINLNVPHHLVYSIVFVLIGFSLLFLVEFIAKKQNG